MSPLVQLLIPIVPIVVAGICALVRSLHIEVRSDQLRGDLADRLAYERHRHEATEGVLRASIQARTELVSTLDGFRATVNTRNPYRPGLPGEVCRYVHIGLGTCAHCGASGEVASRSDLPWRNTLGQPVGGPRHHSFTMDRNRTLARAREAEPGPSIKAGYVPDDDDLTVFAAAHERAPEGPTLAEPRERSSQDDARAREAERCGVCGESFHRERTKIVGYDGKPVRTIAGPDHCPPPPPVPTPGERREAEIRARWAAEDEADREVVARAAGLFDAVEAAAVELVAAVDEEPTAGELRAWSGFLH